MRKSGTAKYLKVFLIGSIVFLGLLELHLRFFWGFGDAVLMQSDKDLEYIAQPNQNRFRFRNHININSFSMRSAEPDSTAFKILGLGDSVMYGGAIIDQDSLMTTMMSEKLTATFNRKVQLLNVAMGSWGPDNCYAYLKKYGDFNAKLLLLVVSSHDAFDNMDFRRVVDHDPGYESKQYKVAIWELIDRYALPRLFPNEKKKEEAIPGVKKKSNHFNSGFQNIYQYAQNKNIPLVLYLHADTIELRNQKYNIMGKQILDFCNERNIKCVSGFDGFTRSDYRDVIHLKESGQRKLTEQLFPVFKQIISEEIKKSSAK